jgi:hypothetical protein
VMTSLVISIVSASADKRTALVHSIYEYTPHVSVCRAEEYTCGTTFACKRFSEATSCLVIHIMHRFNGHTACAIRMRTQGHVVDK